MYFVRPTKSGRGTTVVTEEEQPKEGADFSIDNGVCKDRGQYRHIDM